MARRRRSKNLTKKIEKALLEAARDKTLIKEYIDNRPIEVRILPKRGGGGKGGRRRRGRGRGRGGVKA
jgi:hypothetical protein